MAVLKKRVKGSTLIESISATVVIMICFSVVTAVFVNVFQGDDHTRKFNAWMILKNAAMKIKADKDFVDQTYTSGNFTIEKTVSRYSEASTDGQQVWTLKMKLIDVNKKILSEYKELVIN